MAYHLQTYYKIFGKNVSDDESTSQSQQLKINNMLNKHTLYNSTKQNKLRHATSK
ncbi:709_t:CDS:1, partial [Cetraspora pellucida]